MKSLLFVIVTWIERMILENMGWACMVASMSKHLQFDSRRMNLRKLGEMNIIYSKIRSDHKDVTENLTHIFQLELQNVLEGQRHLVEE